MEPSGKVWPPLGTPALNALIMVELATITFCIGLCSAEETTAQSSYPLKSENAIPLGDFSEYLSGGSAAATTSTVSAATAAAITVKQARRFAAVRASVFCSDRSRPIDFAPSSGMVCSPSQLSFDQRASRIIATKPDARGEERLHKPIRFL